MECGGHAARGEARPLRGDPEAPSPLARSQFAGGRGSDNTTLLFLTDTRRVSPALPLRAGTYGSSHTTLGPRLASGTLRASCRHPHSTSQESEARSGSHLRGHRGTPGLRDQVEELSTSLQRAGGPGEMTL